MARRPGAGLVASGNTVRPTDYGPTTAAVSRLPRAGSRRTHLSARGCLSLAVLLAEPLCPSAGHNTSTPMVVSATASTAPPPLVPPVDSVDTFVFGSAVVRATENGARRPQRSMGLWVQGRVGTGWGGAGDSAKTIKMEWGLENYYPEWSMVKSTYLHGADLA